MSHHPSYAAAQPHPLGTQDKGAPTPVRGQVQHPKDVEPNPRKLEEMKASSAHKDDPMDEGGEAEVKVRDVASEVHKPVVVYALRVLDPAGAGVMGVRGEDVAEKDVAWLRQQIQEHLNKVGPHPPDAEKRELCLYQQWGEWLEDDVKLVQIPGQK
jgi:hypothetical protein